ncbi:hypothetical protein THAOC_34270 [Thalassiosira oceanica]|uniref:Uncharacterized protein n=1 Tax=Thalassiosira oceanica TaxID=159749 RepID=K0R2T0_THAOC|nr:hypothetical protein THAOC_34270 [Thalassiosira oceanica]|eukprot:EJK47033.1 hypothetical protein THAOC_34270 [Thalassiosira oceanica]
MRSTLAVLRFAPPVPLAELMAQDAYLSGVIVAVRGSGAPQICLATLDQQGWEFPAYHTSLPPNPLGYTFKTPIGRGKYDRCCSGVSSRPIQPRFLAPLPHTTAFGQEIVFDEVIRYSTSGLAGVIFSREVAYKCK